MKKRIFTIYLISLFFASCTDSDENTNHQRTDITFKAQLKGALTQTRALDTSWQTNDEIGVYMLEDNNSFEVINNVSNKKYITSAGGSTATFVNGSASEAIHYPQDFASVKFLSYSPFVNQITNDKYLIDISNQSSLPAIDLILAEGNGSKNNLSPTLTFKHQLNKVVFNIVFKQDIGDISDVKVKISNVAMEGTFDFKTKEISKEVNSKTLVLNANSNVALTYITEGIVIPDVKDLNRLFIFEFNLDGVTNHYEWNASNQEFVSGFKNIYNVTLNKVSDVVVLDNVKSTIADWNLGNGEDGEVIEFK